MIETNPKKLKQKNKLVITPEELADIVAKLEAAFVGLKGYGLAANQIGIHKQVAIIRMDKCKLQLVNPQIISKEDKFIFRGEGCLSFPGLKIDTDRYLSIVVESGLKDQRVKYAFEGLESIVIQHEYDHLMGRTILEAKHKGR